MKPAGELLAPPLALECPQPCRVLAAGRVLRNWSESSRTRLHDSRNFTLLMFRRTLSLLTVTIYKFHVLCRSLAKYYLLLVGCSEKHIYENYGSFITAGDKKSLHRPVGNRR